MFEDFDFSLLDDPDFKEDSVREELISPLLNRLGYSASGANRIIRSKSLAHPYVLIGTKSHKVNIIPDYLLKVGEEHCWILDAKAPGEEISKGRNVEQVFSYAIHPDVRAFRYALCNGRELVVFDVNRIEPQLNVRIDELEDRLEEVKRFLSPLAFTKPHVLDFKPDFGLHMAKMNSPLDSKFFFVPIGIGMVSKVEDGLYTAFIEMQFGDLWLAVSLDFDDERFEELMRAFPEDKAQQTRTALRQQPYCIAFRDQVPEAQQEDKIVLLPDCVVIANGIPEVCVDARFGNAVHSNENEDYLPLWVERFHPF
jgi:hypothetical protein